VRVFCVFRRVSGQRTALLFCTELALGKPNGLHWPGAPATILTALQNSAIVYNVDVPGYNNTLYKQCVSAIATGEWSGEHKLRDIHPNIIRASTAIDARMSVHMVEDDLERVTEQYLNSAAVKQLKKDGSHIRKLKRSEIVKRGRSGEISAEEVAKLLEADLRQKVRREHSHSCVQPVAPRMSFAKTGQS